MAIHFTRKIAYRKPTRSTDRINKRETVLHVKRLHILQEKSPTENQRGQLIELTNGKQLFMLNGYTYYKKNRLQKGHAIRWPCTKSSKCSAYLHLDEDLNLLLVSSTNHSHYPDRYLITNTGKYIKV
ncbi:uncharacterized protein LOC114240010 [Bombyx mandarina]|uniref:Uncharacterized protein LOC114240010 n=1 Tax=Bombyx mandarina TaxID=7092 RepID=A0A6J2JCL8_BOMMA|nr:uncharacterized protein LOC114240010 [Bombyx mandarina]